MADKDYWEFTDDFFGDSLDAKWTVTETGTPAPVLVNPSSSGEYNMLHAVTTEAENICLDFGDFLCMDIDKIREVEFRVKGSQAAFDATSMCAFGISSARNDAHDSLAVQASFRVVGADDTTAIVVETDANGAGDNNDVATAQTLVASYRDFVISFAEGTDDVRFFIDGQPVATGTTFDMSNYTGSVQLFAQMQKTSDNNTDGITIDRISIRGVR
jgi:hypothetical protein